MCSNLQSSSFALAKRPSDYPPDSYKSARHHEPTEVVNYLQQQWETAPKYSLENGGIVGASHF
jgi:hypothetical protein